MVIKRKRSIKIKIIFNGYQIKELKPLEVKRSK